VVDNISNKYLQSFPNNVVDYISNAFINLVYAKGGLFLHLLNI